MFRLDGEVFLLGTAIPAPSKSNKNCDDLRLVLAGRPRGGGWIVANDGSYSEMPRQRKTLGRGLRRGFHRAGFISYTVALANDGLAKHPGRCGP